MSVTAVPIQPVKRSYLVWLWLGVILAITGAVALAWIGTSTKSVANVLPNEKFLAWNARQAGVIQTASGLQYQVLAPGEGASPTDQDVTLVNYKGTLRDGTAFDESRQPTPMPVSGMIPGFSEGLKLMKKGSKYRFWIKPELAYGDRSPDPARLPNGSLLIFEVEMIEFIPAAMYQQMMQMQQGGGMPGGAPGGPPPGGAPPQ